MKKTQYTREEKINYYFLQLQRVQDRLLDLCKTDEEMERLERALNKDFAEVLAAYEHNEERKAEMYKRFWMKHNKAL